MPAAFAWRTTIWEGGGLWGSGKEGAAYPSQSAGPDISQGQMPLLEHDKDACFHLYNLQSSYSPFSCCPPDRTEELAWPLLSPHPAPTVPPEQVAPVPAPVWIPSVPSRLHDGQFVYKIHTGQEVLINCCERAGERAGRGLQAELQ